MENLAVIKIDCRYLEKINDVYTGLSKRIENFQPTQEFINGLLKATNIRNEHLFKREMNRLAACEATRQSYLKVVERQRQDSSTNPELYHPHPSIVVTPPPSSPVVKGFSPIVPHNTPLHRPIDTHSVDVSFALSQDDEEMDEEMYEEAWDSFDRYQYYE